MNQNRLTNLVASLRFSVGRIALKMKEERLALEIDKQIQKSKYRLAD